MSNLDELIEFARSFYGVPYKWGGRNRLEGFDCSQFVVELLISSGILPHGTDLSAQGIFDYLVTKSGALLKFGDNVRGSIVFYGSSADDIVHVAFSLSQSIVIEAGGGTSKTKGMLDAIRDNACVRMRPLKLRKDFFCCILPNYDF